MLKFIYIKLLINLFILFNGRQCVKFELGPCLLQYLEPCSEDIIQFYLFASDRPTNAPILLNHINPIIPKWIDLRKTNKLIVHGYGGNLDFHATKTIRNAYLAKNNTNVIIIDWGKLANLPCYPTASFNTKQAGECSAMFLKNMYEQQPKRFKLEHLHMIGFSLGAHIVAFISNALHKLLHIKINRITGLDPALPFFTTINRHWKLDNSDAKFVDVIHTNAGVYGKIEPCGHIDFYVNGGQNQPACIDHSNFPLCSHMLSTVYFAESINSGVGFWGIRCTSYFQYLIGSCNVRSPPPPPSSSSPSSSSLSSLSSFSSSSSRHIKRKQILMGEYCSIKSSGIVFIDTNSRPPYALG